MQRNLFEILTYKRPAGSDAEEEMIKKFIDPVDGIWSDEFGNRMCIVGDMPTTMFSCHTDTVHRTEGRQKVLYDDHSKELFVNHGECLGADDGAGIILMLNMIEEGVEGLYVFHREEEVGGRGSAFITKETPWLIEGIERCIAFDRMGIDSVITYQGAERCCSDTFADALCKELGSFWFPDPTGVFTDSANYTHLIPECTNLSIGYQAEHTKNETLSVGFLENMIELCCKEVNWESLPTERNPAEVEWEDDYLDRYYSGGYRSMSNDYSIPSSDPTFESSYHEVLDWVYEFPEDAAELIQEFLWEEHKSKQIS